MFIFNYIRDKIQSLAGQKRKKKPSKQSSSLSTKQQKVREKIYSNYSLWLWYVLFPGIRIESEGIKEIKNVLKINFILYNQN